MARADGSRTILLIDDDDDYRDALAVVLEGSGYRVRCAANGREGVLMAAEEPPDAILLDFLMPAMDGPETSRRLRALPALRSVPILVLTAFGTDPAALDGAGVHAPRLEVQDYLEKAADFDVLLARVAAAMSAHTGEGCWRLNEIGLR